MVPKLNRPISVFVQITINGRDFVGKNFKFTYYDPYIIKFEPKLISIAGYIFLFKFIFITFFIFLLLIFFLFKGTTIVKVEGFGFANTSTLKFRIGENSGDFSCQDNSKCEYPAKFIIYS